MSTRIFKDVEEALAREVRRITFHNSRTQDEVVLQDQFDPLTGELVQTPIEARFTDSSADAHIVQYPHFFIRLLKSFEDRFTGRVVPQYGRWIQTPTSSTPKAFEIVTASSDGTISAPGNELKTSMFQIAKVQAGHLLRILNGNNVGTYTVSSVTKVSIGQHSIFVSNTLLSTLPAFVFDSGSRTVVFNDPVDLNTIKVGDNFVDASAGSFPITAIDINTNSIVIGGVGTPDLSAGSSVTRTGNVFQTMDPSLVRFLVLDPTKPISIPSVCGDTSANSGFGGVSPEIPVDAYYMIRIDSKEHKVHVEVLNRMWEEFNPPRTGLPVIKRTKLSAEQALTADIPTGGSQTVNVADNSKFNLNDPVFIFNDLIPTKGPDEKFLRPFESKVIGFVGTDQIVLEDEVPDTFKIADCSKIVSHAEFRLFMFHFRDHNTKDVEGSNYWVHEFIFWVQLTVDRLGEPLETGVVTEISTPIGDLETDTIIIDDI
jgi:hypothetical protein